MAGSKTVLRKARSAAAKPHHPDLPAGLDAALRDFEDQLAAQNDELRVAQAELEESRDRYAALYDWAPVGYVTLTSNGLIVEINLTGAALLGRSRAQLIGTPFNVYVFGRAEMVTFLAHLRQCRREERVATELRLKCSKDEPVSVQLLSRRQSEGGSVYYFTALSDLTEQKLAEKALHVQQAELRRLNEELERRVEERTAALHKSELLKQAVFDAIAAQIIVVDRAGEILEVNKLGHQTHAPAFFGCDNNLSNYLQICRRAALEDKDGAAQAFEGIAAVLDGKLSQYRAEYRTTEDEGRDRWFALTVTPLSGRAGAVVLHEEISDRKLLERELLVISEKERRRIGQDLHDGLCQHLSGTALMAAALKRTLSAAHIPQSEQASEIATLIGTAVDQARDLARGLHPVDIDSRGLVSALQELASAVSRRVECEFRSVRDVTVVDPEIAVNFYRIAQEAVTNALKHADPKKIVITLRQSETSLTLTIDDDGSGFGTSAELGKGMGIQIMKYRASTLGANLNAANRPGGGVRVRYTLPLGKAARRRS